MLQQAGSTEAVSKALSLLPTQSVTAHTQTHCLSMHGFSAGCVWRSFPWFWRYTWRGSSTWSSCTATPSSPIEWCSPSSSVCSTRPGMQLTWIACTISWLWWFTAAGTVHGSPAQQKRPQYELWGGPAWRCIVVTVSKILKVLSDEAIRSFQLVVLKKDHFILYHIKGTVWNFRKMTKIEDRHDSFVCTVKKNCVAHCWMLDLDCADWCNNRVWQ